MLNRGSPSRAKHLEVVSLPRTSVRSQRLHSLRLTLSLTSLHLHLSSLSSEFISLSQILACGSRYQRWKQYVVNKLLSLRIKGLERDLKAAENKVPLNQFQINAAEVACPPWFSPGVKSLIHRILDPNPKTRIQIKGIKNDPWFKENYVPVKHVEDGTVNLDDVRAVFDDIELRSVLDPKRHYKKGDSKLKTLPKYFQVGTVI